jgi:transposase
MARYKVTLTTEERDILLNAVTKGAEGAAKIKHANILLAVDCGEFGELKMTDEQAAAAYHATARTVYNVKKSFVEDGFESALLRKKREHPPKITIDGEAEAKIVALTCSDPPKGHSKWSLRLIAERTVELGILPAISHVAVGDLLKKTKLSHGYTKNGASPSAPASS